MSKSRVFGQQVEIFLSKDGSTLERLGEIDNFSSKSTPVVKENASLGESGKGTIAVLDNGGTLSFEAKESGADVESLFVLLEGHYRASSQAGKRGASPYFEIRKKTTYDDGSVKTIIFEGVALHDDESSVGGRTEEVQEKWQGTYKRRSIQATAGFALEDFGRAVSIASSALSNLVNLQGATVRSDASYKERSVLS